MALLNSILMRAPTGKKPSPRIVASEQELIERLNRKIDNNQRLIDSLAE